VALGAGNVLVGKKRLCRSYRLQRLAGSSDAFTVDALTQCKLGCIPARV
jgi:hypothetical protein